MNLFHWINIAYLVVLEIAVLYTMTPQERRKAPGITSAIIIGVSITFTILSSWL